MTDEARGPLRRPHDRNMTIRKLAPKTQQGYIRTIRDLSRVPSRSPDRRASRTSDAFNLSGARGAHVPDFQSHRGCAAVLFRVTLSAPTSRAHDIHFMSPGKLPSCSVRRKWRACWMQPPGFQIQGALSVAYGAGLRAAEVIWLRSATSTANAWSFASSRQRAAKTVT